MIPLALSLLAMLTGGTDFLLSDGAKTTRLRVVIESPGQSLESDWGGFLDKLFDHFDRDGDRFLSKSEAKRVFALPLPGGREAKMDYAKLDANGDGKATRAEFQAFYRAAGFTPVVVVIHAFAAEHRRLSANLFRNLDRDGDGKLTRAELDKAPALLRRFDENEDEILTSAEMLALESSEKAPSPAATLKTVLGEGAADAVVYLSLVKSGGPPKVAGNLGALHIAVVAATDYNGLRTAKGFYLAQFSATLGSNPSLGKADLESDPSLQAVAAMFEAADRNGDSKLTSAELRAFLDLVELGVGCQAVVTVEDRGANLFDLLDENRDGVLDLAELNRAAQACADASPLPLKSDAIPRQVRLSASRGPVGLSFGPVPVPASPAPKTADPVKVARGPKWFQAMDKNSDGFVSTAEFIGPPELFRKLDADGDGRVSAEEADRLVRE